MWPDSRWLKLIELKPRYLFGLWTLGILLLFLPSSIAASMGFLSLRAQYRGWIGAATLGAFVFWSVQLVPFIEWKIQKNLGQTSTLKNLSGLSREERFLLAYCVDRNERTLYLPISNGPANSLSYKGLMEPSRGIGTALEWSFTIPLPVWEFIRGNRRLILHESDWQSRELADAFRRFDDELCRT